MKKHEAFPGKFFKAADLDKPRLLTFARIVLDKVTEDEEKLVAYFLEDPRGMVINPTKFETLVGLKYGIDSDMWVGKSIVAFQSVTPFAGKMVPCIALRAPRTGVKPAIQVPQVDVDEALEPADIDDDIPF